MKLKLGIDMDTKRAQAYADIDAKAEAIRALYITVGSGQAMAYMEKQKEAADYLADPAIDVSLIPHLTAEATAYGVTVQSRAELINSQYLAWKTISPVIEVMRLQAKDDVAAATTPQAIDYIVDNVSMPAV